MLEVPAAGLSSFRDLLVALGISPKRIADVGAGGFVGDTTTVHLVDLFPDAHIVAIESAEERIEPLRKRFGGRIATVAADIADYQPDALFDLTVVDLDPAVLHGRFNAPFDDIFPALTASGGIVVTDILLDHYNAFHGPQGSVSVDAEPTLREFMMRGFGTLKVTPQTLVSRFAEHPVLEPIALVEKWRGDDGNFMGWVAFHRV